MEKILVIGSLNMDSVAYVDEMPSAGETVLAKSAHFIPGGKGANQAYAAGRLGADVAMIGAVGSDENGQRLLANLGRAGVNTEAITKLDGEPTGCAYITVNQRGNNSIVVVQGANYRLTPSMIDENASLLDECGIVLLQLEIPVETVCHAVKLARERGKTVILDPAPAAKNLPPELFRAVDIMKPNETELAMLTGMRTDTMEQIQEAAKSLLELGVGTVVVTAGSRGAVLVSRETCTVFPVEDVAVVDTTAAGDSFTAALACALSQGFGIAYAIQMANAVSTVVVTRKGAQSSIPTMDEVQRLWKGKQQDMQ